MRLFWGVLDVHMRWCRESEVRGVGVMRGSCVGMGLCLMLRFC